jgi:hypothetical protein
MWAFRSHYTDRNGSCDGTGTRGGNEQWDRTGSWFPAQIRGVRELTDFEVTDVKIPETKLL